MGLGVDQVAHLNQPSDIGTSAKAGIEAENDRHRSSVVFVVSLQLRQMSCQLVPFGLQLRQTLTMSGGGLLGFLQLLRRLVELLAGRSEAMTALGQTTMFSFQAI
jgi:hypothetical protein